MKPNPKPAIDLPAFIAALESWLNDQQRHSVDMRRQHQKAIAEALDRNTRDIVSEHELLTERGKTFAFEEVREFIAQLKELLRG